MSKTINILITIDTDAVRKEFKNPSQDPKNPTSIAHNFGYMVSTGMSSVSGQGTGDLSIKAFVGDTIRAFATSGSENFEDAVLLFGMPKFSGTEVLGPFNYQNFTKSTVAPNSVTSVLPATIVKEDFWFYQASVAKAGTEGYMVQFALYTRSEDTGQPVLYGYFQWDPTITVVG